MDSFAGKNIWIVGASSGIGRALAQALHTRGANLALSARSGDQLASLNRDMGDKHVVLPLDVADSDALGAAAIEIKKNFNI